MHADAVDQDWFVKHIQLVISFSVRPHLGDAVSMAAKANLQRLRIQKEKYCHSPPCGSTAIRSYMAIAASGDTLPQELRLEFRFESAIIQ